MPSLFDPLTIGDLTLANRIIMAPLTRARAGDTRTPNALMARYYAERASAGSSSARRRRSRRKASVTQARRASGRPNRSTGGDS